MVFDDTRVEPLLLFNWLGTSESCFLVLTAPSSRLGINNCAREMSWLFGVKRFCFSQICISFLSRTNTKYACCSEYKPLAGKHGGRGVAEIVIPDNISGKQEAKANSFACSDFFKKPKITFLIAK